MNETVKEITSWKFLKIFFSVSNFILATLEKKPAFEMLENSF